MPISYKRHRFLPEIIRHAVRLYFRFTLSLRDVAELLAERGIEVSDEAVRAWTLKFGRQFARNLRRSRPRPTGRWHPDEMVVRIGGRRMYLWRAVDDEGEVLDMLVQKRRDKGAAARLLRKLLRRHGLLGLAARHEPSGLRGNNRAESSHLPIRRRERKQQRFKSQGFLASHAPIYNAFNLQPHLISRPGLRILRAAAHRAWACATAAA